MRDAPKAGMHRRAPRLRIALLLLASLVGAAGCSTGGGSGAGGGGNDDASAGPGGGGGDQDGSAGTGPVSVPAGSPVTVSPRAADGSVSGTYTDARTQQTFSFTVRATGASSAVAAYALDTLAIQVTLSGPSAATIGLVEPGGEVAGALTGYGPMPTDSQSQVIVGILAGLFAPALRAIPFAPAEIAAMLVPWQVIHKYFLDAGRRYDDVRTAADGATCALFDFAGASATAPPRPITKPPGTGLVNLGNDDPFPTVLGFFPLDAVGAKDPAPSQTGKGIPPLLVDAKYGK